MIRYKIIRKITFLFALLHLAACTEPNEDDIAIVGQFTWNEWQQKAGWDKTTYDVVGYIPDSVSVAKIKEINVDNSISFILFTSNWCLKDCKVNMPKIMNFLETCGVNLNGIPIYGVSRNKKEPTNEIIKYNIKSVPTIVILKNGEEIGKVIAETTNIHWEQEIASIISIIN